MENSVIQRIRCIIKSERISISSLSKMIDVPQPTLHRQVSGESSMTLDVFVSIMNCFPKVSLDWVLRGKGEMLNNSISNSIEKEFVIRVDNEGYLKIKRQ